MTSKLYSESLTQGRRCIVICEGFYEWKTVEGPGKKKPYFIHTSQENEVCVCIKLDDYLIKMMVYCNHKN